MKKTSITALFIALSLILTATIVSCLRDGEELSYTIGLSQCADDAWRRKMNQEMQMELLFHPEMKLEVLSADDDSRKQSADIDYFISKKIDLLIVSPNEANGVTDAVSRAYDAGIPVIVADRRVNGDKYTAFIGGDNVQVGVLMAKEVEKLLPEGGKVVEVLGRHGSTPAILRHQGFRSVIDNNNSIKVVHEVHGLWHEEISEHCMDSVFALDKDIDVVVAQNDLMAMGAYNAAAKLGIAERIKFVGVDALGGKGNGVEAISDGKLDASVSYATVGDLLVYRASQILEGKNFPKDTLIKSVVIDKATADVMMLLSDEIDHKVETINMLDSRINEYLDTSRMQKVVLVLLGFIVVATAVFLIYYIRGYRERKRMYDELFQTQKKLDEANKSKLDFFTNVSHDFRTPLTLIAYPLEDLEKSEHLTLEERSNVKLAIQNANVLLRLINQTLDFRKIEDGKMELVRYRVDLCECMQQWTQAFKGLCTKKHIHFSYSAQPDADYTIGVDVYKVERIFYNLMANAFKFTDENGTIRVELSRVENNICFSISDNGPMLNVSQIHNIFENFYQADSKRSDGSGIGLALVKSLVTLHGGTIGVEANEKSGEKSFNVSLPIPPDTSTLPTISEISRIDSQQVLTELDDANDVEEEVVSVKEDQKLVLVIDDNKGLRNYVRSVLEAGGDYAVQTASNGAAGITKAVQTVPDLIICDISMPGMDGFEVCDKLKSEVNTSHIPIIMLTAYSLDEQRVRGLEGGVEAYITKPFNPHVLIAQVNSLIKNRTQIKTQYGNLNVVAERVNSVDDEFLKRMVALIDENISNVDLSVESLGESLGMSRSQLYRKLKALTNYSPNEFMRNRRLQKSRQLLSTGQYNVSEVCFMVGFTSPGYFSRCYTSYYGEAPSGAISSGDATKV